MSLLIYINEIHPNPETGNEWIELWIDGDANTINDFSLNNYTIFDSTRQIYKFSNEQFLNQLLVVEVSGLNNDLDSVILKDETGNILDSFSYTTTQKGLSFAREIGSNNFILNEASRNQINPRNTPAPTNLEISPTASPSTIQTSTSPSPTQIPQIRTSSQPTIILKNPSPSQTTKTINLEEPDISPTYRPYDLSKINLKSEQKYFKERQTRLVFLGKNLKQTEIQNAIIGSSLIILSSIFLIYVKVKSKHN
jgi:hypothetical protein